MPRIDGRCSYIEGNSAVYKNSSLGPPSKRQKVKQVRWADITRDNSQKILLAVKSFIKFANGTLRSPITMRDNKAKSLTNIVGGCNDYTVILGNQDQQKTLELMAIKETAIRTFNEFIAMQLKINVSVKKLSELKHLCELMKNVSGNQHALDLVQKTQEIVAQQMMRYNITVRQYLAI